MVPLSFAGHDFQALPEGALFWPGRRALLVADLHFEKASWFAARGQMLPPYDSIATLTELTALADRVEARELWCLGDSFHDSQGCERLPEAARRWPIIAGARSISRRWSMAWCCGTKPSRAMRGPRCRAISIPSCACACAGGRCRGAASWRPRPS
jgi:hypothetical protein